MHGAGGRAGRVSAGDVRYSPRGRKHLIGFQGELRCWGRRGKGQTDGGLGGSGSKSRCGGGCGMRGASPRDAGFAGMRSSASLPHMHQHPIYQEPSSPASMASASVPVHPVSAWCQVLHSHTCPTPDISGRARGSSGRCFWNLVLFFCINKNTLSQELSRSLCLMCGRPGNFQ